MKHPGKFINSAVEECYDLLQQLEAQVKSLPITEQEKANLLMLLDHHYRIVFGDADNKEPMGIFNTHALETIN